MNNLLPPQGRAENITQELLQGRAAANYSLLTLPYYLRLLILSAVDSYNLIYSLACVNMSKIAIKVKVKSEK